MTADPRDGTFVIEASLAGRLDRAVKSFRPELSWSEVRDLITRGKVLVDGRVVADPGLPAAAGAAVTIAVANKRLQAADAVPPFDRARILQAQGDARHTMVELTLHSGRNRIVRRMLDAVGHPVVDLVRRSFGPLNLGTLRSGAMRELTKVELGQLLTLSRAAEAGRKGKR